MSKIKKCLLAKVENTNIKKVRFVLLLQSSTQNIGLIKTILQACAILSPISPHSRKALRNPRMPPVISLFFNLLTPIISKHRGRLLKNKEFLELVKYIIKINNFDIRDLNQSGIYLFAITNGKEQQKTKLLLVK